MAREIPQETREKILSLQNNLTNFISVAVPAGIAELGQLERRFSRGTLNIGIVGNAGQGKSTFIQRLTGLSDEQIPTAAGAKHCTGAPSVIVNDAQTFAVVDFYTQDEFLKEIVHPYFRDLELGMLPMSLSGFFASPIPAADLKGNSTKEVLYDNLKELHCNAGQYRDKLGSGKITVSKDKFREHIAKIDGSGKAVYLWLAVKNVEIHCPFKVADVGQVSICDTPGLGDFISGADKNLSENIGGNIDAVVMQKRTSARVGIPDTNLYNLLLETLPELDRKDWSHFILNCDDTATQSVVDNYIDELRKKFIETRRILPANCTKEDEVQRAFNLIIEDIAKNQQQLDETLYTKRTEKVKQLAEEITAFLVKAKEALPKGVAGSIGYGQLQPLFNAAWQEVELGLSQIVKKYRSSADTPDARFAAQVDEVKKAQAAYLTQRLDAVQEKDYAGGKLGAFTPELQHELRIELSKAFDRLDMLFHEDFTEIRRQVFDIFVAAGKGKLGEIIGKEEPVQWFTELANRWQHIDTSIAETITSFATSAFSFSAYLLPRIREKLNVLDSDSPASADFGFTSGDDWEIVREKMELAFEKALNDTASSLKKLSADVNKAKFAMIEQFADGVLRSGSHETAKNHWYAFYEEYRGEIWTDMFAQLEENTKIRNDWNRYVAEIETAVKAFA